MSSTLVLGGTGRTGRQVIDGLLRRDKKVVAIVRSPEKLEEFKSNSNIKIVQANLLDMDQPSLVAIAKECDSVVSCLGHVMSPKIFFFSPLLCRPAAEKVVKSFEEVSPQKPARLIWMNTTGCEHPDGNDVKRGIFERGIIRTLAATLIPFQDNIKTLRYFHSLGTSNASVEWCVVRPDDLIETNEITEYRVQDNTERGIFNAFKTNISNVANFMAELATNQELFERHRGKFPVVYNSEQ